MFQLKQDVVYTFDYVSSSEMRSVIFQAFDLLTFTFTQLS